MQDELNGWLNIDKPLGYSSAKVVAIIKRLLKVKKVGHGGTLDPLATGVLPICINKATKTTEKIMSFEKEYLFDITFGEARTTCDAEGEIIETNNKIPTEKEILNILSKFIGNIMQTPPIFSAIKVDGKRAYDLARNGKDVELKAREVKVYKLEFLGFKSKNTAQFKVKCGKGFYVRSLAIDLSRALDTVGYISYLRRLSVGIFDQTNILNISYIEDIIKNGGTIRDNLLQL
ncbi:MAG TPA: tRNA pseudouridine(55) synthase TruB [Rickettsiales bacterium]|nr:tRNA pseudouridine(55) synthase TruB [Rickettsiales bacterium]